MAAVGHGRAKKITSFISCVVYFFDQIASAEFMTARVSFYLKFDSQQGTYNADKELFFMAHIVCLIVFIVLREIP